MPARRAGSRGYDARMTDEREPQIPDEPPTPGERRLARPPSDRYRAAEARAAAAAAVDEGDSAASIARGVAVAVVVAIIGVVATVLIGGVLLITESLLIIAGFTGGGIGAALRWGAGGEMSRRQRAGLAVLVAVAAVGLGQVALWQYARTEGGVLPLFDYLGQVYGPLVLLQLAAAAALAWLAAR
jgi:hypothetical protein